MIELLNLIINAYILLVLAYAIISWIPKLRGSQFEKLMGIPVEPVLKPIRKLLEPIQGSAGIDFSPIVLFMILYLIRRIV